MAVGEQSQIEDLKKQLEEAQKKASNGDQRAVQEAAKIQKKLNEQHILSTTQGIKPGEKYTDYQKRLLEEELAQQGAQSVYSPEGFTGRRVESKEKPTPELQPEEENAEAGQAAGPNQVEPEFGEDTSEEEESDEETGDEPEESNEENNDKGNGKVEQLFSQAKDWIKKNLTKQALKAAAKAVWAWMLANWWIVLIVVAVIVIIVLFGAYWSQISDFFSGGPSRTGTTQTQPVDPMKDANWLNKLLYNAGDTSTTQKMLSDKKTEIISELDVINNLVTDSATKQKITTVRNEISNLNGPVSATAANKIISDLKDLVSSLNPCLRFANDALYTFSHEADKDGLISGSIQRSDGTYIAPDKRICELMETISVNSKQIGLSGNKIRILTMVSGHKKISTAGLESAHWTGRGIDVDIPACTDGKTPCSSTTGNNADSAKIAEWISQNHDSLSSQGIFPDQLIDPQEQPWCTWQIQREKVQPCWYQAAKHGYDHEGHVHIGMPK